MMSGGIVENTVKFCFPVSAPPATWAEIAAFLKQLEPNVMQMETVYKMGEDRSLRIKYQSTEAMKEALQRNLDVVKFQYSNGKSVQLRMLPAGDNIRYVRVFDVPPEVADEDVKLELRKYGKIERMVREKFPSGLGLDHMFNGVRGLYMVVETEIPPTIGVLQWKAKIFYEELRNKCFSCQSIGHQRSKCPQRSVQGQEKNRKREGHTSRTYAGVVIQAAAPAEEIETIEILEEEVIEAMDSGHVGSPEIREAPLELEKEQQEKTQAGKKKPEIDDDYIHRTFGIPNATQLVKNFHAVKEEQKKKLVASQRRAQFASSGSIDRTPPSKSSRKGDS